MRLSFIYMIFFVCLFHPQNAGSQINVKIGYVPAYGSFSEINSLLDGYNDSRIDLEKEYDHIHVYHGIELGLRYKKDWAALDLSWQNMSISNEVIGINSNDQVFTNRLFFGLRNFSAAIESHFNRIGLGVSIDRQKFKIQKNIPGSSTKRSLVNDTVTSNRFYLIFVLQESSSTSFVLKPFIQVPWGKHNIEALQNELSGTDPPGILEHSSVLIGLTFSFYNGAH